MNEHPVPVDYVMFYTKLLRYHAADRCGTDDKILKFVGNVEKIAVLFSQYSLIDASMNKYKPSVVAATLVFVGFKLAFE